MTINHLAILPAIVFALSGSNSFGQYSPNLGDPFSLQDPQIQNQESQFQTNAENLSRYRQSIDAKVNQLQTKMLPTMDGNIIFQFPNYDIAINGTPSYPGQGNGTPRSSDGGGAARSEMSSTRVIWKSDQGYAWDGSNFLLSPNYSYELYTGDLYRRRVIGKPEKTWTPLKCEPSHDDPFALNDETNPFQFLPTTTKSATTLEKMHSSLPKATWPTAAPAGEGGPSEGDQKSEKIELDEMDRQVPGSSNARRFQRAKSIRTPNSVRAQQPVPLVTRSTLIRRPVTNNRSLNSSNLDFLRNGMTSPARPITKPSPRQIHRPGYSGR